MRSWRLGAHRRAGARVCLWLLFAIIVTASPAEAVVVTDAFFREDLTYPTPQHRFGTGSLSVDTPLLSGSGAFLGHLTASAATTGGLTPTAAITVALTGTGVAARDGDAYAGLTYYWAVEQIAGPPTQTARIRVQTSGSVSSAVVGDAAFGPLYAEAVIRLATFTSHPVAGLKDGMTYPDSFDLDFTTRVAVDTLYSTSLVAYGIVGVGWHDGPGQARVDAFVDPLIEIDPTWSRAADFRVLFSTGIGQTEPPPGTTVPAPAAFWLLGAGLIALIPRARRRRAPR